VTSTELIATLLAEVPERIVAQVREVVAAHSHWQGLPAAESLVSMAAELLRGVLAQRDGNGSPRDQALDILTAGAYVTWAFEAAADELGSLGAHTSATMERPAAAVISLALLIRLPISGS
jgi:hypothetical protein